MGVPDIGPALRAMFILAVFGFIALAVGGVWGVWWLFTHISITII